MGSSDQNFYEVLKIAERTLQAIKMGNIGGPIMGSRTITRDESEMAFRWEILVMWSYQVLL